MQDVYGTVLDAETLEPIDSVYVYKQNDENDFGYTDLQGHFEVESISGGFFGCPPMTVELKKQGYEVESAEIEVGSHAKVFMRKVNN
ncbi:hypothetical protein [Pontibacter harenae]|uniref:hypothetical protein n=1 Tax=Pontibacter harenae TaxID=2894083 RepID=UPI001E4D92B5|nr:hypothetical protein [Pontibacter harenae]MCC9167967.1 hypothetical protein [Pontibacter harenae]